MHFIVAIDGAILALLGFLAHWDTWIIWMLLIIAVICGVISLRIFLSCGTPQDEHDHS